VIDWTLLVAYAGVIASVVLAVILIATAPRDCDHYDWEREGDFR
jgi:hypothetical protein